MSLKLRKWQIAIVVIVLLLIILNPGLKDFKEHTGDSDVTKKMNFLICSIYEDGNDDYLGIALNFIKLPHSESEALITQPEPKFDSTARPSSAAEKLINDTAAFKKFLEENSSTPKRKRAKKDPLILDSTDQ